jgi:hypothetical protein
MGKMGTRNSRSMREGKSHVLAGKMSKLIEKFDMFEKGFYTIFEIQAVVIKISLQQFRFNLIE